MPVMFPRFDCLDNTDDHLVPVRRADVESIATQGEIALDRLRRVLDVDPGGREVMVPRLHLERLRALMALAGET